VGLPAVVLRRLRGMPFVYHIADMWPESVVESGMLQGAALRRMVHGLLSCGAARSIDSEGDHRAVAGVQAAPRRTWRPADKIHVIYNWTDETMFHPFRAMGSSRASSVSRGASIFSSVR